MWKILTALQILAGAASAQGVSDRATMSDMLRQHAPACVVPDTNPGERLLLVGASTPTAVSGLFIAESSREAQAVTLIIDPGPSTLRLVISAESDVIYSVDDPSRRVSQLQLLVDDGIKAGVAGLPRDRMAIVTRKSCVIAELSQDLSQHIGNAALAGNIQSRKVLLGIFGRLPELVALRDAKSANLPSGTLDRPDIRPGVTIYMQGRVSTTVTNSPAARTVG